MDAIASHYRVSPDLTGIMIGAFKEFSLTCNYVKGHGELFYDWILLHHPNEYIFHPERVTGSRQDVVCIGSLPLYWNRHVYLEFLYERIRECGSVHILQNFLACVLGSVEVGAAARLFSIIHLAIVVPLRWLSGNTHKLEEFQWGPISMGLVLDILHEALTKIKEDQTLILTKTS